MGQEGVGVEQAGEGLTGSTNWNASTPAASYPVSSRANLTKLRQDAGVEYPDDWPIRVIGDL